MHVYAHFQCRSFGATLVCITRKALHISSLHVECEHHIWDTQACGAESTGVEPWHACTCLLHLLRINSLYHTMSVYMRMHKTLETLETLALRAWVSKPVSAFPRSYTLSYIPPLHGITYICIGTTNHLLHIELPLCCKQGPPAVYIHMYL